MPAPDASLPAADDPRLFLEMATSLAGSLQRGEVVRRVLEWAISELGAVRATLSHLTGDSVVIEATAGQSEALTWVGRSYPMDSVRGQAPVWEAISQRRIVITGPLESGTAFPEFREALRTVRHVAIIPLLVDDEPIGMLVVNRDDDHPFTDNDMPAMNLLGGVAALALRNALLFQAQQASAAALSTAVEAARDIAEQSETQDALGHLLSHAVRVAGADEGSMMRLDGDHAVVQLSTGSVPAGARFPLARATEDAIANGAPRELAAADYLASHPDTGNVVGAYARFLIVPLIAAGNALGVLALGRRADTTFTVTETEGVQQVATLAAMLLRNAFLLDEARQANHARVEFVNMAVHELRAPLTVIQGYLSMLADGDVRADAVPALVTTMRAKAGEMGAAIEEMLSMARLEAHSLPVIITEVGVGQLVADAVERGHGRAELRGGSVEVGHVDDVQVGADTLLAGRILDNLVNNAIAYCDGPPHVVITAEADSTAVQVRVHDSGRGIPPGLGEKVFERFFRVEATGPGTGLGLYLSRGLAEAMGGGLVLDSSTPGEGSVFRLTLPRAAAALKQRH